VLVLTVMTVAAGTVGLWPAMACTEGVAWWAKVSKSATTNDNQRDTPRRLVRRSTNNPSNMKQTPIFLIETL
jgi:hypothetical protein